MRLVGFFGAPPKFNSYAVVVIKPIGYLPDFLLIIIIIMA